MNEEIYIRFESYLDNEMTSDEKSNFENQLKTDSQLEESFELYKEATQFLAHKFDAKTINFKQNLESISKENFADKQKAKVIAFKPWYYAAAASLVIGFGLWFMNQGNPNYSDYNQHETAMFLERSEANVNLKEAQEAFNGKKYPQAIVAFEKIGNAKSPETDYFFAIALIETRNYTKAEKLLKIIKDGTSVYNTKALWYLALSNLKQENFDQCKLYLKEIPIDAEDYDKAQELLKKLE